MNQLLGNTLYVVSGGGPKGTNLAVHACVNSPNEESEHECLMLYCMYMNNFDSDIYICMTMLVIFTVNR